MLTILTRGHGIYEAYWAIMMEKPGIGTSLVKNLKAPDQVFWASSEPLGGLHLDATFSKPTEFLKNLLFS